MLGIGFQFTVFNFQFTVIRGVLPAIYLCNKLIDRRDACPTLGTIYCVFTPKFDFLNAVLDTQYGFVSVNFSAVVR
jgi:hypothetical protein